ncbi:MAG: hypothetical protein WKF77_16910 [Planctomycetaceae bacterium]
MIESITKPGQGLGVQGGRSRQGMATPEAREHSEGVVARTLEEQTAKLPSDVWLWAALASMGASLCLRMNDRKDESLFIGQWAAPFLLIGVYNKLVKIGGSDRVHQ